MLGKFDVAAMIPVRDLPPARQWYFEKLGFQPEMEMSEGAMYRSGNSRFMLYQTQFTGPKHTLMGWQVDDLDREMRELRAKGVKFEDYDMPDIKTVNGVATMGNDRGAWFKDLDGNILSIIQMVK